MYKGKEYKLSKEIIYFEDSREFGFVVSNVKEGDWYKLLTDGKKINNTVKTSNDSVGYETINLEKNDSEEKDKQVEEEQAVVNQENTETTKPEENNTQVNAPVQGSSAIQGISDNKAGDKNSQPVQETKKSQSTTIIPKKSRIVYHTVQPKETLYHIAMEYYHSQAGMNIIRQANHIQGDNINAGQVLKIPLNK